MRHMMKWTIDTAVDPETGDYILKLPEEVLEATGWQIDDILEWIDNEDGTWTLRKKNND